MQQTEVLLLFIIIKWPQKIEWPLVTAIKQKLLNRIILQQTESQKYYIIIIIIIIISEACESHLNLGYYSVLPERYDAVHGVLETFRLWYQLLINALYVNIAHISNNSNTLPPPKAYITIAIRLRCDYDEKLTFIFCSRRMEAGARNTS